MLWHTYNDPIFFSNNSALTTSVVGTLKSVAQTTMGMFTFGGVSFNPALLTGVTMNLTGGIFYTYAKYRESQRVSLQTSHTKQIQRRYHGSHDSLYLFYRPLMFLSYLYNS